MKQNHDPVRQLSYLQQSLSNARRPIGFFLGAGCPLAIQIEKSPLIPDIAGLTSIIENELLNDPTSNFQKILNHFSEDGNSKPNIEAILTFIRSLQQVAGKGEVRGFTSDALKDLDNKISQKVVDLVGKDLPSNDTPYHHLASWISAIPREESVEIFTTNYDLLIEQALEIFKVPYFDGFIGSKDAFFDTYSMEKDELPKRWTKLWKLHGSINWWQNKNGTVSRGGNMKPQDQRYVIHPSHLKYDESRRMPYLAMIDRLRAFLRKPSAVLITIGYSFGDFHLNEVLFDGLQSNPTAIIFALLYNPIAEYKNAIQMSENRHNLNLLAKDEAVIGMKQAPWLSKEKTEIPNGYDEIEWIQNAANDHDTKKTAQFRLGDFKYFGQFLRNLTGETMNEENSVGNK